MPKVSIYLPDALHRRAVEAGIPITKICQSAVAQALDESTLSVGAQLRRLALALEEVAAASDTRIQMAVDLAKNAGVDPRAVWGELPWVEPSYDLD